MKNRKGFTLFEAVIAVVMMGFIVAIFVTTYTHSFRTIENSRKSEQTSHTGQQQIETAVSKKAGDVERYLEFRDTNKTDPLPQGLSEPDLNTKMWGNDIRGYSVGEVIRDSNADSKSTREVFSFVYVSTRLPQMPHIDLVPAVGKDELPKIMYLEDAIANNGKTHWYRMNIINPFALRRVVERTYSSQRTFEVDGRKYISRPFSDVEYSDEINPSPAYSPSFPNNFSLVSSSNGRIVVKNNVLNSHEVSYSPIVDTTSKKIDTFRDVELIRTVQTQSINHYAGEERVVLGASTWLVGTPTIDSLAGHWDANLIFSGIGNSIESIKDDIDLSETVKPWNSVGELTNRGGRQVKLSIPTNSTPKLVVKESGTNNYRRFSNGVQLPVGSRVSLDTRNANGIVDNGKKHYTVFIRAKQLDPNSTSALLSINTNDAGSIISSAPSQEAFGMFINTNSSSLFARYDAGVKEEALGNQRNFSGMLENPMKAPKYTDAKDDRAGYRVYGLRFKNAGQEDKYAVSVFVDGDETTKKLSDSGMANVWLDLDIFGMDIGSNLEVSDILLYEKEFSNDEIKAMSEYLYKKYEP